MGPSMEDIANFIAITGAQESIAVEWLKLHDDQLDKATNAFFDDPGFLERHKHENAYDESQFHTDRTNDVGQQSSFYVHQQDSLKPNVFDNLAPSRPPSRVSGRNEAVHNAPGAYNREKTLAEQEEEQIQQAIAMSTSQTWERQETGTTGADKPYFGPASAAKEIILGPDPQDRRRQPSTPAFLRPTLAGHRLPGLVKILHAIPAAREALLCRPCIQSDYAHNDEWWDGVPIEYPQILHGDEDEDLPGREILYEPQRLMAFLDDTERAYGSCDALSALPNLCRHQEDPVIKEFLEMWSIAAARYNPGDLTSDLFCTRGVRSGNQDYINILDLEIDEQHFEPGQSLYDTIDSFLWSSWDGTEADEEIFLDRVADVLVIRVERGDYVNEGLDIKIPPVWYSDRYRQSAQPQVRRMFAAKLAIKHQIKNLEARQAKASKIESFHYSGNIAVLLDRAKQYFKKTIQYRQDAKEAEPAEPTQETKEYIKVADELNKISDRVARKLQELEESKEKAQAELRELSKLLTELCDIPEESPHDRYTLRGVCAEPYTVYVQEHMEPETEDNLLDLGTLSWQWWKLNYDKGREQNQISCTKVREIEVLKAARDESPGAILVYASDKAMSVKRNELPPPLKSFVQTDNRAFAAELISSSPQPTSPIKDHTVDLPPQPEPNSRYFRPPPKAPRYDDPSYNDSDLPSYSDNPRVFPPPARDKTYDDFIPASLRHSSLDLMDLDEGVEMMERDREVGGAFKPSLGGGEGEGYQLGSYEPDLIDLEDREDEVKERKREV